MVFAQWLNRIPGVPLLILSSILNPAPLFAGTDQSSLSMNVIQYGSSATNSLLGTTGYGFTFLSEPRKAKIRLVIGSQLELAQGLYAQSDNATLMRGAFLVGTHFFPFKTEFVAPFIGTYADIGWGYLSLNGTDKSIGLNLGVTISGGAEVRFSRNPDSIGLRIGSSYRLSRGQFTGQGTIELDGLMFFIGVAL